MVIKDGRRQTSGAVTKKTPKFGPKRKQVDWVSESRFGLIEIVFDQAVPDLNLSSIDWQRVSEEMGSDKFGPIQCR
jgi:hypothetical protein